MPNHYETDITSEDYEAEYEKRVALTFGEPLPRKVVAMLPSLEGVLECGVGVDELEAREDYLEKLENLIYELQEKHSKVQYEVLCLEYTEIGGM